MSEVLENKSKEISVARDKDEGANLLQVISNAASNPNCDIQKMQALLDMQKQLMDRQSNIEFSEAMSRASAEIPQIEKNGTVSLGGKGGYKFTRWEDMDYAIRPILQKYNLRLSFNTRSGPNGVKIIIGTITHANGCSQSSEIELPIDAGQGRNALQGFGSTISYGKRYCAEMLLNIVRRDEDKDGKYPPKAKNYERITPEQKEELIYLMQKAKMGPEPILASYRVSSIDDLPIEKFQETKNRIWKRINNLGVQS